MNANWTIGCAWILSRLGWVCPDRRTTANGTHEKCTDQQSHLHGSRAKRALILSMAHDSLFGGQPLTEGGGSHG